jgi:hypothetical protein
VPAPRYSATEPAATEPALFPSCAQPSGWGVKLAGRAIKRFGGGIGSPHLAPQARRLAASTPVTLNGQNVRGDVNLRSRASSASIVRTAGREKIGWFEPSLEVRLKSAAAHKDQRAASIARAHAKSGRRSQLPLLPAVTMNSSLSALHTRMDKENDPSTYISERYAQYLKHAATYDTIGYIAGAHQHDSNSTNVDAEARPTGNSLADAEEASWVQPKLSSFFEVVKQNTMLHRTKIAFKSGQTNLTSRQSNVLSSGAHTHTYQCDVGCTLGNHAHTELCAVGCTLGDGKLNDDQGMFEDDDSDDGIIDAQHGGRRKVPHVHAHSKLSKKGRQKTIKLKSEWGRASADFAKFNKSPNRQHTDLVSTSFSLLSVDMFPSLGDKYLAKYKDIWVRRCGYGLYHHVTVNQLCKALHMVNKALISTSQIEFCLLSLSFLKGATVSKRATASKGAGGGRSEDVARLPPADAGTNCSDDEHANETYDEARARKGSIAGGHTFDEFKVIAALSERIQVFGQFTSSFFDSVDFTDGQGLYDRVLKAFGLFNLSETAEQTGLMTFEEFKIICFAGNVNPVVIEGVLRVVMSEGKIGMDFLDFLSQLPLFLHIHNEIIGDSIFSGGTYRGRIQLGGTFRSGV